MTSRQSGNLHTASWPHKVNRPAASRIWWMWCDWNIDRSSLIKYEYQASMRKHFRRVFISLKWSFTAYHMVVHIILQELIYLRHRGWIMYFTCRKAICCIVMRWKPYTRTHTGNKWYVRFPCSDACRSLWKGVEFHIKASVSIVVAAACIVHMNLRNLCYYFWDFCRMSFMCRC